MANFISILPQLHINAQDLESIQIECYACITVILIRYYGNPLGFMQFQSQQKLHTGAIQQISLLQPQHEA